jgi:hypothetical protein
MLRREGQRGSSADYSAEQVQERKRRKNSKLQAERAEVLDGAEAVRVEGVVDVLSQVGADDFGGEGDAGCPLADEGVDVGEASVTAGGEVGGELRGRDAVEPESSGAHGPDGCNPREAGVLAPESGEVKPEERTGVEVGVELARNFSFDLCAVLACKKCGVTDEECGVGGGEHGDGVCALFGECGAGAVEVLEKNVRVGGGAARGGVSRDGANVRERFGDREIRRILDEQKNAAYLAKRGDGAAGHDGEFRRELGDGNEPEVGGARVEFTCAVRGRCVVELVLRAKSGCCGVVLKVEEEWGRIQEGDGGNAKRHKANINRIWLKDFLVGFGCGTGLR